MIICRTPYRLSFFGGGTDHPAWYLKHGGSVLASTVDKYCYLSCRFLPPFFEHNYRIVYSKIECTGEIDSIQHPAVREVLKHLDFDRGLEIHHDGDLPARSGMGTSSSFTVGLLHALYALRGQMPTKESLARESIHVEQELLKETVGSQDQVSAAYGGLNHIVFMPNGEISVQPVTISRERILELRSHLMLFYTGIKRTSSVVADSFVPHLDGRRRQLRILKDLVDESISILSGSTPLSAFGDLLHEAWEAKRGLSNRISNSFVDDLYDHARAAGALGGKLTGAGGGGFLLLFAPPEKHDSLRKRLRDLIEVPFEFDFAGSQVIFVDRERDYASVEQRRKSHIQASFKEMEELLPEKAAHA